VISLRRWAAPLGNLGSLVKADLLGHQGASAIRLAPMRAVGRRVSVV
jgi:hypothetical protein